MADKWDSVVGAPAAVGYCNRGVRGRSNCMARPDEPAMNSLSRIALCLAVAPSIAGCMAAREATRMGAPGAPAAMPGGAMAGGMPAQDFDQTVETAGEAEGASTPPRADQGRKIIFNGEYHLVAPDLDAAGAKLLAVVKRFGGFISASEVAGAGGTPRTGHWQVRVPAARFEAFMTGVGEVAEVEKTSRDSEDVTEEFLDLTSRLKNKRVEEVRLIEHLKRSTARLKDILDVEKELSRVREEIEQMEGRLRYLTHHTDLSTVEVYIREAVRFEDPRATGFGDQMSRTLRTSWEALVDLGKGGVLYLVALVPWMPFILVGGLLLRWLIRRAAAAKLPKPIPPGD